MTDILTQLKEQTASFHNDIEQNDYARALMGGTMSLDAYRAYLEKFYGFIEPMERKLTERREWSAFEFELAPRLKAPLLEADLRQLGLSDEQLSGLPRCEALPDVADFSRALGYLYVIEGSTLGGQLVMRKLQASLQVQPEVNGRYFNSYGEAVREKWKQFRELLVAVADRLGEEKRIVDGATETFVRLERWFAV